jgi:hypothetical protein
MIKKGTLWMADWFDSEGHRRRKGFNTERQAIAFQNKMRKETTQSKKARASRRCAHSSRRGASSSANQTHR